MMTNDVWGLAAELPSVKRFLTLIVDDLAEGRSVIVLLPPGIGCEQVEYLLEEEMFRRGLSYEVDFDDRLARALALPGSELDEPEYQPDVFVVKPDCEDEKERLGILARIRDRSQQAQAASNGRNLSRILLIVQGSGFVQHLPPTDLYLSHRWWWGFPSELEVRLLWRLLSHTDDAQSIWVECVGAAFGAGDLALAAFLMIDTPTSMKLIPEALAQFARQNDIATVDPTIDGNLVARSMPGDLEMPPPAALTGWVAGQWVFTYEHGLEEHPAALAAKGNIQQLGHRLWRSQLQVLLPRIDRTRISICRSLTDDVGPIWFKVMGAPLEDRELKRLEINSFDAELGYLLSVVGERSRSFPKYRGWMEVLRDSWDARNTLAHYQPLDFPSFQKLSRMSAH